MNLAQALAQAFLNVQRKEGKWAPERVARSAEVRPRIHLIQVAENCTLLEAHLRVMDPDGTLFLPQGHLKRTVPVSRGSGGSA